MNITKQRNKIKILILIVVLIGILIRGCYMLETKVYQLQYDLGIEQDTAKDLTYDDIMKIDRTHIKENGNLEYLVRIYQTGRLLGSNSNQGYHPPLHHYITAGVMRICDLFGAGNEFKLEMAEFPAFVYSILILVIIYKITKELEFTDKGTLVVMTLASFNPLLIYLSRLINNDPLVTLCTLASIWILIKWYKEPSIKLTVFLALVIGAGASTKISIIVMALPLLVTYLMKMSENIDDMNFVKKLIKYGVVFSIISLPLVFWYPIRNAIKFGQPPFGVVEALPSLAVGHTDFVNRWLINNEFFAQYLAYDSSNVWSYVINSSILFSANTYFLSDLILNYMRILTVAMAIIFIASMIKFVTKNTIYKILAITAFAWLISFIAFNISLPFSCTMHSRYIGILFILGMIFIGKLFESTDSKKLKVLIGILSFLYSIGCVAIFATIFSIL